MDESGFSLVPPVRKTWAPRGRTPLLRHKTSWPKLSAISGVGTAGQLLLSLKRGTIGVEGIVAFLRGVLRQLRGPVIVIWDGLPLHKAQVVLDYVAAHPRLIVEPLPSYSPDLNADEGVWQWLKREELGNLCVHDLEELEEHVRQGARRIRARPELIQSFLKRTGLDMNTTVF